MFQWSGHQTGCKTHGRCGPAADGQGEELVLSTLSTQQPLHPTLKVNLTPLPLPTASHGFCPRAPACGSQNLQGVVEQGTSPNEVTVSSL